MTPSVLVIAAHPDDEVLGCGGTMRRHSDSGDRVEVLFLADGVGARATTKTNGEIARRQAAARQAASILGAAPPRFLDFPDNRLDTIPLLDIVQAVERVVAQVRPTIVYVHHAADLNVDHRIAHQAAITACRPLPNAPVKAIYAFETLSSTEWGATSPGEAFRPQRVVDISSVLEQKCKALAAYTDEMRDFPHPRSVEGVRTLASLRGCQAGLTAGEAFMVVREVITSASFSEKSR